MCNFLKIKYSQNMIDTKKFMGLGENTKKWKPNSNFKSPQKGIYKSSLNKWKSYLNNDLKSFIKFVVGPELKYLGYEKKMINLIMKAFLNFMLQIIKVLKDGERQKKPWIDINFEIKRNELIKETKISKSLIKNYFLFSEIHKTYESIKIMENIKIGNSTVGRNSKVYFIADIAANHDGSLSRAALIRLCAKAGANEKFQYFKAETIVSDEGFKNWQDNPSIKWKVCFRSLQKCKH